MLNKIKYAAFGAALLAVLMTATQMIWHPLIVLTHSEADAIITQYYMILQALNECTDTVKF